MLAHGAGDVLLKGVWMVVLVLGLAYFQCDYYMLCVQSNRLVSWVVTFCLSHTLTWFHTMYPYLLPTVTTGCISCEFLNEFCI